MVNEFDASLSFDITDALNKLSKFEEAVKRATNTTGGGGRGGKSGGKKGIGVEGLLGIAEGDILGMATAFKSMKVTNAQKAIVALFDSIKDGTRDVKLTSKEFAELGRNIGIVEKAEMSRQNAVAKLAKQRAAEQNKIIKANMDAEENAIKRKKEIDNANEKREKSLAKQADRGMSQYQADIDKQENERITNFVKNKFALEKEEIVNNKQTIAKRTANLKAWNKIADDLRKKDEASLKRWVDNEFALHKEWLDNKTKSDKQDESVRKATDRARGIYNREEADKRAKEGETIQLSQFTKSGGFKKTSMDQDVFTEANVQKMIKSTEISKAKKELESLRSVATKSGKVTEEQLRRMSELQRKIGDTTFLGRLKKGLFTVNGETQGLLTTFGILGGKIAMWGLLTGAIYGTMRAITGLAGKVVEINTTMTNLRKVMKSSGTEELGKNMSFVRDQALAMGQQFGASFTTVVDSMRDFVRQGYSIADASKLTKTALMAVNIAGLDQAEATKYLISTMQQFNMEASDSLKILNSWNQIENTVGSTTKDLAEAVSKSGSSFKSVGGTFDELNALAVTTMKATGQSGSQIGNMLKTLSVRYADVNKKQSVAAVLMDKAKIGMVSAQGAIKPITQTLSELAGKWSTLDQTIQSQIASAIAGTYHNSRFKALMENWDKVMVGLNASLNSNNSALNENEQFMQSLQKQLDKIKASYEQIGVSIEKNFAGAISKSLSQINSLVLGLQTTKGQITLLTGAVTAVSIAFVSAGFALKALKLEALFSPLGWGIAAFGALAAAVTYYIVKQGKAKEEALKYQSSIQKVDTSLEQYKTTLTSVKGELGLYAQEYQKLSKQKKDTSVIVNTIINSLYSEGVQASDTQRKLLGLALSTKDVKDQQKKYNEFLKQAEIDKYSSQILTLKLALVELEDQFDDLKKSQDGFWSNLLGDIASFFSGAMMPATEQMRYLKDGSLSTDWEKEKKREENEIAQNKIREKRARIEKMIADIRSGKGSSTQTTTTDTKWGDGKEEKLKKETGLLNDALRIRINNLKLAKDTTKDYSKSLDELNRQETLLRISMGYAGKEYDKSIQQNSFMRQKIKATANMYKELNDTVYKTEQRQNGLLKNYTKLIQWVDKNYVSGKKLTAQQIADLEQKKEALKTRAENIPLMNEERKNIEQEVLALTYLIEQYKQYDESLDKNKERLKTTRSELAGLIEAYTNMADVADGTGETIRNSLKSGLSEFMLSGFNLDSVTDIFSRQFDGIKAKIADSISEGLLYGVYGGKEEFNRQIDDIANNMTKMLTGKSAKDVELNNLREQTKKQFEPIIVPIDAMRVAIEENTNALKQNSSSITNTTGTQSEVPFSPMRSPVKPKVKDVFEMINKGDIQPLFGDSFVPGISSLQDFQSGKMSITVKAKRPESEKPRVIAGVSPESMANTTNLPVTPQGFNFELPPDIQEKIGLAGAGFGVGGLVGAGLSQLGGANLFGGDIGAGTKTNQMMGMGSSLGGAIGNMIVPGLGGLVGGALGGLVGGLFGSDEDRKQQRRLKEAQSAVDSYNSALNRQSNTMDETHEKVAALNDIIKKMGDAGQDASQYQQELERLTSPEQRFRDRIDTLEHDVAMTRDKNVANKKYLDGLVMLQKQFSNSLSMQSKRWLEETVFKLQQDVTINATVRTDQDLETLTKNIVKKIAVTEALRGNSYTFI